MLLAVELLRLICRQNSFKVLLIEQDGLDRVLRALEHGRDTGLAGHAREEGLRRRQTPGDQPVHRVEEVPQLIELEGEDGSRHQVVVAHELRELLLFLSLCYAALLLLDLLLERAISPQFDSRVTRTGDHFQSLPLSLLWGCTRLVPSGPFLGTTAKLQEVHRPNLLLVHLESVLALLLTVVPNLDDAIDAGRGYLEARVQPSCFDQGLSMPLKRGKTLSRAHVPHLARLVARGRD